MWMFLEPDAAGETAAEPVREPLAEPAAPAETVADVARAAPAGAYLPANGGPPHVVRSADASRPAGVRLYVHPGRMPLGEMSAERVAGHLDMERAVLFGSLAAAELAAEEGAGFLVEVGEPFLDGDGERRESGCYFVGRLR